MKLVINYDFFNQIRDASEKFGPLKIVRNNKTYFACHFPFCMGINLTMSSLAVSIVKYGLDFAIGLAICWFLDSDYGRVSDPYKLEALKILSRDLEKLNQLYINTNIDLLLESELYSKNYRIYFNKKRIPSIFETKYILVPTYTATGNVKKTSIKQEHVIGTKQYILSIGSHGKRKRMVHAIE